MSEVTSDPGQPPKGQESIDKHAWSSARQWQISGIAGAVVVVAILLIFFGGRLFGKHEPPVAEAPSPPGTFRATPQQMKTLTVEPVGLHGFVSEELTEGKIAVNGDHTTPLYSPYCGLSPGLEIPSRQALRSRQWKLRSSFKHKTILRRPCLRSR
jgi:hypothetical protein